MLSDLAILLIYDVMIDVYDVQPVMWQILYIFSFGRIFFKFREYIVW